MTLVIGVDCATQPAKTGVARARFEQGRLTIEGVQVCSRALPPVSVVATWLHGVNSALLALDAPLGWPAALASSLCTHAAGAPLRASADDMFNRATDKDIARRFGKKPLEVGANLIARTAHSALTFLQEVRETLKEPVSLAWTPGTPTGVMAIEVYPATTKLIHGVGHADASFTNLPQWVDIAPAARRAIDSPHARDAVLCAIAGADFVAGRAIGPTNSDLASREGWIWSPARPTLRANKRIQPPRDKRRAQAARRGTRG